MTRILTPCVWVWFFCTFGIFLSHSNLPAPPRLPCFSLWKGFGLHLRGWSWRLKGGGNMEPWNNPFSMASEIIFKARSLGLFIPCFCLRWIWRFFGWWDPTLYIYIYLLISISCKGYLTRSSAKNQVSGVDFPEAYWYHCLWQRVLVPLTSFHGGGGRGCEGPAEGVPRFGDKKKTHILA